MTATELGNIIKSYLGFDPTDEQEGLIAALGAFVTTRSPNDVFVLNGYAGTGKTSVVGALVKTLERLKIKTIVLAPTGRAAKVAAKFASGRASTIHKRLFRGNSADPGNFDFFIADNRDRDTIFIIDEASLVTDGTGFNNSLLMQLVRHVYSSPGCGMILLGDLAQLPPVGQSESMAMNGERLKSMGLNPIHYSLISPVRQAAQSGILYNATVVRQFIYSKYPLRHFALYATGFPDVETVDPTEMLDYLSSSWNKVGKDETLVITRSNYRANNINHTIRNQMLDAEGPLLPGEKIIISKNDYFWSKENKLNGFLANGETAEITRVGRKTKKYGRWFADVEMKIAGFEGTIGAPVLLRSLVTEGAAIPREEMQRFYNMVVAEKEGELSEKIKAAQADPYYNALQVKYGYCVTCHKAQGGQWKHVYIDLGSLAEDADPIEFYRWLYTAITRATEKLYFVNPPFVVE